ncbi:MAG: hypothetical protein GTO14_11565, partial [Anaerolineales bacterium]|nr:hypothetical protein [Anaerolineales bacterium]
VANLVLYDFTVSYETTGLTALGYLSAAPFSSAFPTVVEDAITAVTGESVGQGDDSTTVFNLEQPRLMCGSETIYLGGVPQTRFTDYTINYKTGQITFTTAPGFGVAITADYEIPAHVRVSFSMPPGTTEGASGNRTLATLVFVVDGRGMTFLDLHSIRLSDPSVVTIISDKYNGYFR